MAYNAATGMFEDDSLNMFSTNNNASASNSLANSFNTNLANTDYGQSLSGIGIDVGTNTTGLSNTGTETNSSIWDNALGQNGWANTAISGATSLANSWLGFEDLGVAKDQYALEKEQYEYNKTNYDDALERKAAALANS